MNDDAGQQAQAQSATMEAESPPAAPAALEMVEVVKPRHPFLLLLDRYRLIFSVA